MGKRSSSSFADFVCVLIGLFAATAISIIICLISAFTNSEVDPESDDVELDNVANFISVDKDSERLPLCD